MIRQFCTVSPACHPSNKGQESTATSIRNQALKFPHVVKDTEISNVVDEWKLYQDEDVANITESYKEPHTTPQDSDIPEKKT